jgi:CRP-like cAMP-binding protein
LTGRAVARRLATHSSRSETRIGDEPLTGPPVHDMPPPHRNGLLAGLPDAIRDSLLAASATVNLPVRQVVAEPGQVLDAVIFPTGGAISLIAFDSKGDGVEVGTVGREGMLGIQLVLGAGSSPIQCIVQLAGSGVIIPAGVVRREYGQSGAFTESVNRYIAAFIVQTMQSVACNRLHSLQQRASRWLLSMDDRVQQGGTLVLTQDFLAAMLGTSRPKVSLTLRTMRNDGLVRAERGSIELLDRESLEQRSCECYGIIGDEYQRLLGPTLA